MTKKWILKLWIALSQHISFALKLQGFQMLKRWCGNVYSTFEYSVYHLMCNKMQKQGKSSFGHMGGQYKSISYFVEKIKVPQK